MRVEILRLILSSSLVMTVGCTKGIPEFGDLEGNIPQPVFDNERTEKTIQSRTGNENPVITGSCDRKIRTISAQVMEQDSTPGSIENISTVTPLVNCKSDQTFEFTLKTLPSLGFTLVEGKTYSIQLRAITVAGLSKPSTLSVRYSTANGTGANRIVISAGGSMSNSPSRMVDSTNFKGIFSVGYRKPATDQGAHMQGNVSSGGNFRAKIGAAAAAN